MPQNPISHAVKTLSSKSKVKSGQLEIELCNQVNGNNLWSSSPTANAVTRICESMLCAEWKAGNEWIPVRAAQYRWLVYHQNDAELFVSNDDGHWDDNEHSAKQSDDEQSNEEHSVKQSNNPQQKEADVSPKFGIIPKF